MNRVTGIGLTIKPKATHEEVKTAVAQAAEKFQAVNGQPAAVLSLPTTYRSNPKITLGCELFGLTVANFQAQPGTILVGVVDE